MNPLENESNEHNHVSDLSRLQNAINGRRRPNLTLPESSLLNSSSIGKRRKRRVNDPSPGGSQKGV